MEGMLQNHVYNDMKNPEGFLRLRAVWLYGEFGDYKFKVQDHIKMVIDSIY